MTDPHPSIGPRRRAAEWPSAYTKIFHLPHSSRGIPAFIHARMTGCCTTALSSIDHLSRLLKAVMPASRIGDRDALARARRTFVSAVMPRPVLDPRKSAPSPCVLFLHATRGGARHGAYSGIAVSFHPAPVYMEKARRVGGGAGARHGFPNAA